VADDLHGAFIETFGRGIDVRSLTTQSLRERGIARVESSRPLKLIDLAGSGGLARIGADNRLATGDYAVSQAWSLALWRHPVQADGIYYSLRHDPARYGCAIFDRAGTALSAAPIGTWSELDTKELARVLDTYDVGLITD
jgi:hypothetical protein